VNNNIMDDALMSMLLDSVGGEESMEEFSSSRLCTEDDWEDHPMGELFRAAKGHQIFEVESLLEQDKYREGVNELDGDGAGVLHFISLDNTHRPSI
jgi:hypothetical protein